MSLSQTCKGMDKLEKKKLKKHFLTRALLVYDPFLEEKKVFNRKFQHIYGSSAASIQELSAAFGRSNLKKHGNFKHCRTHVAMNVMM